MTDQHEAEKILGPMDKMLLEALESEHDFVDSVQLVVSLNLKNQFLVAIASGALPELNQLGLITAKEGTKVKITPLGRKTLEKEGRLSLEKKREITG